MKIEVYYLDGRFESYDTESHFNAAGVAGTTNCMVVYSVQGDAESGLWVRYYAYDAAEGMQRAGHESPCAPLRGRVDVQVLDASDMDSIAWVAIDGQKRYYRLAPGQPLVDGFKFDVNHEIYVGSKDLAATRARAYDLYRVLRGGENEGGALTRGDGESDADFETRIASMIGWDASALAAVVSEMEETAWAEENEKMIESGDPEQMAEALAAAYDPSQKDLDDEMEDLDTSGTRQDDEPFSAPNPLWAC